MREQSWPTVLTPRCPEISRLLVQASDAQGLKGQSQCGLEEVQEAMPRLGDSSWASFQSKKDLDEQRFMGFSLLVLATFQSVERKHSMLLLDGHKLYLPNEGTAKRRCRPGPKA